MAEVTGTKEVNKFMDWDLLLNCCMTTDTYSQLSSGGAGSLWGILASSFATAAAFISEVCWLRDVCVDQGWVMLMECCNIIPIE